MLRGKSLFICSECKHSFTALDMEYQGTVYSCPQRCPKCGSMRTLPLIGMLQYGGYKKIWDERESL